MRYLNTLLGTALVLVAGNATAAETGLDWLAGHWCGEDGAAHIEEFWLPQAGGVLLGMSRTATASKLKSFEFMRIADDGKRATLHAQPNGAPPTAFTEAERGKQWIRFENAEHDFPNRIEYRRDGQRLNAWIAGPGRDGKELKIPFAYQRCKR